MPVVDHGLDELRPWAFRKTNYNQIVVNNPYVKDPWGALKAHNAPWWGLKLAAPAFFTREKYQKFFEQWGYRVEFETLKMKHAAEFRPGDLAQRDQHKSEVIAFLRKTDEAMRASEMKDVYVTDHQPVAKKYVTLSEEEDQEYYNYLRQLEDYNAQPSSTRVSRYESGRYERGSLKQRIFEPLAGARKLENGTLFYEVSDAEIADLVDEGRLRKQFDNLKEVSAIEAEDDDEVHAAMFDRITAAGFDVEEWDKILAREFNTFQEGEEYDYATDLRRTFDQSLQTSLQEKIFRKIPAHVFWDIKRPNLPREEYNINPWNPARKYPHESFFDMRRHEDWLQSREEQRNIDPSVSKHNRL